jgi:hypothetical protein
LKNPDAQKDLGEKISRMLGKINLSSFRIFSCPEIL